MNLCVCIYILQSWTAVHKQLPRGIYQEWKAPCLQHRDFAETLSICIDQLRIQRFAHGICEPLRTPTELYIFGSRYLLVKFNLRKPFIQKKYIYIYIFMYRWYVPSSWLKRLWYLPMKVIVKTSESTLESCHVGSKHHNGTKSSN